MAKCLRCGATEEWIQGTIKKENKDCDNCLDLQKQIVDLERKIKDLNNLNKFHVRKMT